MLVSAPPDQITLQGYTEWLRAIDAAESPFAADVFAWYDEQASSQLPPQVDADPDKIYIAVDRAIGETDKLEEAGEIGEGTTVGFDSYRLVDVSIAKALETILFFCGKPIGQTQGETFPFDMIFGRSHCSLEQKWGAGNYLFRCEHTKGGLVNDIRDDYTLLVRGDAADDYTIFNSFWRPTIPPDQTQTSSHISLVILKARSDSRTEMRHSLRRNGQSYARLGKRFGFNVRRIRNAEKAIVDSMVELHVTGKIRERRQ